MFNKILVVCVGNICRSPIGERALRQLCPNKQVDSAGVGALVGKPANSTAALVAAEKGLSLDGHVARQLTPEICQQYDLILVMEKSHIAAVANIAPEARGKVMLFGQWIGQKEIPDPYKQSKEAFDFAYDLIEQAANGWVQKLS